MLTGTFLYIPLKLNELVCDVSFMRMLENCQRKFYVDFLIFIDHIFNIFDNTNLILQKAPIMKFQYVVILRQEDLYLLRKVL